MASSATSWQVSEAKSFAIPAARSVRSPRSFMAAAWRVRRRAASILVAMSASFSWMAWCSQIGFPNVVRCWA